MTSAWKKVMKNIIEDILGRNLHVLKRKVDELSILSAKFFRKRLVKVVAQNLAKGLFYLTERMPFAFCQYQVVGCMVQIGQWKYANIGIIE